MSFKVIIPSYKRANIIIEDTIPLFISKKIQPNQIDIWVANSEEYEKYNDVIPKDLYNEIHIGEVGKHNQINLIRNYYPNGSKLLFADDDLLEIYYCYNHYLKPLSDLYSYSKFIFSLLKKYRIGLGGTTPTTNPFFMSNTISLNNYMLLGGLQWVINNNDPQLNVTQHTLEDLEFSLKNYLYYGNVLKSNEIMIKDESRYSNIKSTSEFNYKNKKGRVTRYTGEEEQANMRMEMVKNYPHLVKFYKKDKNRVNSITSIKQKNGKKIELGVRIL